MAAGLLTARLFLVCVLSEVSHSSALPRVGRSLEPQEWQDGRRGQEGHFHPFQYMMALRQTNRNLHDQVQVKDLRSYQPRSSVPTQRLVEPSVLQPRALRHNPMAKPRSFDLSLKIPFAHGNQAASRYRPSGFHIHNSFNNPLRNHDASRPGYQFSISVPVSHASPPHHPGSQDNQSGRPQKPRNPGLDHQQQQQVPFNTRPSSPWYSSQRFEETAREGPFDRDLAFLKPTRPSRPRLGYYSSQWRPAGHDYWRHYRGHYHRPHHGHYQSHAEHSASKPWPAHRSD